MRHARLQRASRLRQGTVFTVVTLLVLGVWAAWAGASPPAAHAQVALNTCVVPPAGMVSWWDGDAVFGITALDIQDGNHGTLTNGATTAPGQVGQAFRFNGVDDYVQVPDSANLDITGDITIDAWVNPDITIGARTIVTKGEFTNYVYQFSLSNGRVFFRIRTTAGDHFFTSSNTVLAGAWTHVAAVRRGNTMEIYINGVQDPTTLAISGAGLTEDLGLKIGFHKTAIPNAFDGLVDEVEIFNRALSQAEIQAIFDAGSAGKCKPHLRVAPGDVVPGAVDLDQHHQFTVDSFFDVFLDLGEDHSRIDTELVALQLRSITPIRLDIGAISSTAARIETEILSMDLRSIEHGDFVVDSFFDVFFDLRTVSSTVGRIETELVALDLLGDPTPQFDSFFDVFLDLGEGHSRIDTELVALQLRSITPIRVDIGAISSTAARIETEILSMDLRSIEHGDFMVDSFFDVFFDLRTISSTAGRIETELVALDLALGDLTPQFDSFFDVFLDLGAGHSRIETEIVAMQLAATGDTDTIVRRITQAASSTATKIETEMVAMELRSIEPIQVDLKKHIDSFFDIFTELRRIETELVALQLGNTDTIVQRIADAQRTIQTEILSMELRSITPIHTDLKKHIDSFFDIFIELSEIEKELVAHHIGQTDTIVRRISDAQRTIQTEILSMELRSVEPIQATLDDDISKTRVHLQVISVSQQNEFLLASSESGVPVDVELIALSVSDLKKPITFQDVLANATWTNVATGMLHVEVNLPKSAKGAEVFSFQVQHTDSGAVHFGTTTVHTDAGSNLGTGQ